jgi:hypothetical protein
MGAVLKRTASRFPDQVALILMERDHYREWTSRSTFAAALHGLGEKKKTSALIPAQHPAWSSPHTPSPPGAGRDEQPLYSPAEWSTI